MTFTLLGACLALAAFGAASAAGSLVAWALAHGVSPRAAPRARARLLFWLRLLPTVSGLAGVLTFLPAWVLFEPRDTGERLAPLLALVAVLVASLVLTGLGRGLRAAWRAWRMAEDWRRTGEPVALPGATVPAYRITHAFPVVAVAGIVSPRLFVAAQVLDGCARRELAAVIAHEEAHLAARDNLKLVLMRACGDALGLTRVGRRLERAWAEAAEQAADEAAAATTSAGLHLAAALVKVARLAGTARIGSPACALYEAGSVGERVTRLVEGRPTPEASLPNTMTWVASLLLPAGLAVIVLDRDLLARVHRIAEVLVHL